MGEGFGAYDIGNDTALLDIVTSANVACGVHAGDPNVMDRVCKRARAKGVSISAHPGFNDLREFGALAIRMPAGDVERRRDLARKSKPHTSNHQCASRIPSSVCKQKLKTPALYH